MNSSNVRRRPSSLGSLAASRSCRSRTTRGDATKVTATLQYNFIVRPQKIILYYCFTPLNDPEAVRLWQRTLCEQLSLKGRILISRHGINGTLGGDLDDLRLSVAATREFPGFRTVDVKWSEGTAEDFPRLRVRVRDEIVSFAASDELVVDADGVVGSGVRLSPHDVHDLVAQRGEDVVFFD